MKICPECGMNLADDTQFCGNCGKRIVSQNNTKNNYRNGQYGNNGNSRQNQAIYSTGNMCQNCGYAIISGEEFCGNCGFHVNNPYREKVYPTKKKDNTVFVIFIIFLIVLLICGVVFGSIYLYNSGEGSKSEIFDSEYTGEQEDDENEPLDDDDKPVAPADEEEEETEEEEDQESIEEDVITSDSDYLFPSDRVKITEDDLDGKSKTQVALIRNEIYARHGYMFNVEYYREYFEAKDWYVPDPNFSESYFNSIEQYNKSFIVEYEKRMGWR